MRTKVGIGVLALALVASAGHAAGYRASELQPLPGYSGCVASHINNLGYVVGYSYNTTDSPRACLWDPNGNAADLGGLTGNAVSKAAAINDSGTIAGNAGTGQDAGLCVWTTRGSFTDLSSYVKDRVYAVDINSKGQIAGKISGYLAFVFGLRSKTLALSPTLGDVYPRAISETGTVVGGNDAWPFAWTPDPVPPAVGDGPLGQGLAMGSICGINSAGERAGTLILNDDYAVVKWDAQRNVIELGIRGYAHSLNELGQVVGETIGTWHAFVWSPGIGMVDLGAGSAKNINDKGQIVGTMTYGGFEHATRWDPVPEPAGVLSLLTGLVGCACSRRFSIASAYRRRRT